MVLNLVCRRQKETAASQDHSDVKLVLHCVEVRVIAGCVRVYSLVENRLQLFFQERNRSKNVKGLLLVSQRTRLIHTLPLLVDVVVEVWSSKVRFVPNVHDCSDANTVGTEIGLTSIR